METYVATCQALTFQAAKMYSRNDWYGGFEKQLKRLCTCSLWRDPVGSRKLVLSNCGRPICRWFTIIFGLMFSIWTIEVWFSLYSSEGLQIVCGINKQLWNVSTCGWIRSSLEVFWILTNKFSVGNHWIRIFVKEHVQFVHVYKPFVSSEAFAHKPSMMCNPCSFPSLEG